MSCATLRIRVFSKLMLTYETRAEERARNLSSRQIDHLRNSTISEKMTTSWTASSCKRKRFILRLTNLFSSLFGQVSPPDFFPMCYDLQTIGIKKNSSGEWIDQRQSSFSLSGMTLRINREVLSINRFILCSFFCLCSLVYFSIGCTSRVVPCYAAEQAFASWHSKCVAPLATRAFTTACFEGRNL